MLTVNVSGPDKSGKGHLIAAIAHMLESFDCEVVVQCSETHNAKKLQKDDTELAERLKSMKVVITETQTSS